MGAWKLVNQTRDHNVIGKVIIPPLVKLFKKMKWSWLMVHVNWRQSFSSQPTGHGLCLMMFNDFYWFKYDFFGIVSMFIWVQYSFRKVYNALSQLGQIISLIAERLFFPWRHVLPVKTIQKNRRFWRKSEVFTLCSHKCLLIWYLIWHIREKYNKILIYFYFM